MAREMSIYDCLNECINGEKESEIVRTCMSECEPPKYKAPLLWVGLYVAAASLVCLLAMATDLFNGFRSKKLWFPCKSFTLNAAILSLLAIAMKMPTDLSTSMPCARDQLMKLASTALMCVSIGNFMPSLAAMSDMEIFANLVALALFIVPLISNVCIQIGTGVIYYKIAPEHVAVVFFMIALFVLLTFSALTAPTMKKYLDLKYGKVKAAASSGEVAGQEAGNLTVSQLTEEVKKYWMMAETASPQFVIARSVICTAAGAICLLTVVALAEATVRLYFSTKAQLRFFPNSDYEWSTNFIVSVQACAAVVGAIAPVFRWFTIIRFKSSRTSKLNCKKDLTVEKYWTERLTMWKDMHLDLKIHSPTSRKLVHGVKDLFLHLCIKLQIWIVRTSSLVCLISFFFVAPFLLCCRCCLWVKCELVSKFMTNVPDKNNTAASGSESSKGPDILRHFALYLEGEQELPESTIKKISNAADRSIQKGKKQKPGHVMDLLKGYEGFNGVDKCDSSFVDYISYQPPICWTMLVVTLTGIATAIPNVNPKAVSDLVVRVSEGLLYVKRVEEIAHAEGDFPNLINAAERVWLDIDSSKRRLGQKPDPPPAEASSSKAPLETLAEAANKFMREVEENLKDGPMNTTVTHSMNGIRNTIQTFLQSQSKNGSPVPDVDREMFKKLHSMIVSILAACFVNLPKVITKKYSSSEIEKREEDVKQAALLLGETEEILQFVQGQKVPALNDDQAAYIEERQAVIKPGIPLAAALSSSDSDAATAYRSSELRINVVSK